MDGSAGNSRVLPRSGELCASDRAAPDFGAPERVRQAIWRVRPDVIVDAAAYTADNRAEREA